VVWCFVGAEECFTDQSGIELIIIFNFIFIILFYYYYYYYNVSSGTLNSRKIHSIKPLRIRILNRTDPRPARLCTAAAV